MQMIHEYYLVNKETKFLVHKTFYFGIDIHM